MVAALTAHLRRTAVLRVLQVAITLAALVALLYVVGAPHYQGG